MSELRIEPVTGATIEDWQYVHNEVVPAAAMDLDEVRERLGQYQLEVAYTGDVLVGCTTVRPPADSGTAVTVIVRVLPNHRHQGYGRQLYTRAMAAAQRLGAENIETIVWAANVDGLRFAEANGFVEVSSFLPPDEDVAYLTLRLVT